MNLQTRIETRQLYENESPLQWDNPEAVKKYLNSIYDVSVELSKKSEDGYQFRGFSPQHRKIRIDAVAKMADHYSSLIEKGAGLIPGDLNTKRIYANLALYPGTVTRPENMGDLAINASLWIIDQIKECGNYDELVKLAACFPCNIDIDPTFCCEYDTDLVKHVIYALLLRNTECSGASDSEDAVLVSRLVAKGKHKQDVPSRKRLQNILDLIPKEKIDEAIEYYKQVSDQFVVYSAKYTKPAIRSYWDTASSIKNITKKMNSESKAVHSAAASKSFIQVLNKKETIHNKFLDVIYDMNVLSYGGLLAEEQRKKLPNGYEEYEKTANYEAIAFVLFYLADGPDDLILCGYPACSMAIFACHMRYAAGAFSNDDIQSYLNNPKPNPELRDESGNKIEMDLRDYSRIDIEVKAEPKEVAMRSLKAVLFETTGVMLPRDMSKYRSAMIEILNSGYADLIKDPDKLKEILETGEVMLAVKNGGMQCDVRDQFIRNMQRLVSNNLQEEKSDIAAAAMEEAVELKKELGEIKEDYKELKKSVYGKDKQIEELTNQLAELEKQNELQRKELSNLREIFYTSMNQNNGADTENVDDSDIDYPYEVQSKMIVVGGFTTWIKELRKQFTGNIEFVPTSIHVREQAIRNADIVVFQVNSISHAYYQRVREEAEKSDVQVFYLSTNGVKRCAKEIVEIDLAS